MFPRYACWNTEIFILQHVFTQGGGFGKIGIWFGALSRNFRAFSTSPYYIWLREVWIYGTGAPRTPYGVPLGPGWPQDHAPMDGPRRNRTVPVLEPKNGSKRFWSCDTSFCTFQHCSTQIWPLKCIWGSGGQKPCGGRRPCGRRPLPASWSTYFFQPTPPIGGFWLFPLLEFNVWC